MNLECPGCRSRLKVDPSKLPAGATAAVCPRCRTKILLPGSASPGGEISVQCSHCSARLKVNVARLKPGLSESRCPKCGGTVALPAAPQAAPTRPSGSPPASEMTRRIDPREIGQILGPTGAGRAAAPSSGAPPLSIEERFDGSDLDLGRLIDSKVEKLGEESGSREAVKPPAPPPEAPPPPPPPAPSAQSAPARAAQDASRSSASGSRPRPASLSAPSFSAVSRRPRSASREFLLAGAVGGAAAGAAMAALGDALMGETLAARVPSWVTSSLGARLGGVLMTIVLSALGTWIAGVVAAPRRSTASQGEGPRAASFARITLVCGIIGLLVGAASWFSTPGGGVNTVLGWTRDLLLSGLLAAFVARALGARS